MACPCEVLVDSDDREVAGAIAALAADVAHRVESKYSRYRDDNLIHRINAGERVTVDEETARLLQFADELYRLSDGKFDITSGVLREAWSFDGSDRVPSDERVERALARVGWSRARWDGRSFQLEPGTRQSPGEIHAFDVPCPGSGHRARRRS